MTNPTIDPTIDLTENQKYWSKYGQLTSNNTIPFYGDKVKTTGCCSNFYACKFTMIINKVTYTFNCSEQAFMLQKCLLFNPDNTVLINNILAESDPQKIKSYGRQVKNFDETIWEQHRYKAMCDCYSSQTSNNYLKCDALVCKFSQNPDILKWLKSTTGKVLIEASPYDHIWGVKMRANDPDIYTPSKWHGLNLLGMALMEVRDFLNTQDTS